MKVFMIAAVTADGFIGRDAAHKADWTSKEDKKYFMDLTKTAGTIIFGSNTFKTIGHALKDRRNIIMTSNPEAYEVEGVEFTAESPEQLLTRLQTEGTSAVAVCGGSKIYTAFLNAGLIDDVYLTVEPVIFGEGIKLFSGELDIKLELVEQLQLNSDAYVAHYRVIKEVGSV